MATTGKEGAFPGGCSCTFGSWYYEGNAKRCRNCTLWKHPGEGQRADSIRQVEMTMSHKLSSRELQDVFTLIDPPHGPHESAELEKRAIAWRLEFKVAGISKAMMMRIIKAATSESTPELLVTA